MKASVTDTGNRQKSSEVSERNDLEDSQNTKLQFSNSQKYKDILEGPACWSQLFVMGKLPSRRAYQSQFVWKDHLYIFGGQDLNEGVYGDLWRINMSFLKNKQALLDNSVFEDDCLEVPDLEWEKVEQLGQKPDRLAHHSGVLQEQCKQYFIYGGMDQQDSSETLYSLNLETFQWTAIPRNKQRVKQGSSHPGPRDDFVLWVTEGDAVQQTGVRPMVLFGGYKGGVKTNDLYILSQQQDGQYEWEEIIIEQGPHPSPRSGHSGGCLMNEADHLQVFVFGGAGDNNEKYNDVWEYSSKQGQWQLVMPENEQETPVERGGQQGVMYKNRYMCVFGGIHEVTNELNDLMVFDIQTKLWHTVVRNNKDTDQQNANSPQRNSTFMQKSTMVKVLQANDQYKKSQQESYSPVQESLKMDRTQNTFKESQSPFSVKKNTLYQPKPDFYSTFHITTNALSPKQIRKQRITETKKASGISEQKDEEKKSVMTPQSLMISQTYIVQNADASFDTYFQQMKKRKHERAQKEARGQGVKKEKENTGPRVKIYYDKQPPGRDGHSSCVYHDNWLIFGGDRHHMPFNDSYTIDLANVIQSIQGGQE